MVIYLINYTDYEAVSLDSIDYFLVTTKTPIPIAETIRGIIQEAVRCEPLTSSAVLSVIPPWPPTRYPT